MTPVTHLRLQTFLFHQPCNAMLASALTQIAQIAQIIGDPAVAIGRAALQPCLLNHAKKTLILAMTIALRLTPPRIEPAAMHTQHATHACHAELVQMRLHERVLRP